MDGCYNTVIMNKRFKPFTRKQAYLLPPSLEEWLPQGHLAYFVIEVVEELDLSAIYDSYQGDGRGYPPYDPQMMTALLLYGYCLGLTSSRRMERATHEDVGFRLVSANQHPDHDSICRFRKRHLKALSGLFVQVLRMCQKAKLVKLGHVSLDGTKVRANASKHKAMSYGRMKKSKKELAREVEELFKAAERVDAEEDAKYGKGVRGDEPPEELRHKEGRLKKIREAMAELEAEARAEAEKKAAERRSKEEARGKKLPGRKPKVSDPKKAKPEDRSQRNFTDSESRIMKCSATKSFEQCYNGQAAVDSKHQVIVATGLTQRADDKGEVEPILEKMALVLDDIPAGLRLSGDAGYFSEDNVLTMEEFGLDPYIATGKMKHGEKVLPVRGRPLKKITVKERMSRKLRTKKGKKIYSRRKAVVEPVFGQIKQARGLRQFLLRGLENVSAEWDLWCLSHNLLKLYRYA